MWKMSNIPPFLNRIVGPFVTGVLMAAVATSDDLVSIVTFLALAGASSFLSLPRNERLIARALAAIC